MQLPWPFGSAKRNDSTAPDSASASTARPESVLGSQTTAIVPARRQLTREEQADLEFAQLVKEFSSNSAGVGEVQTRSARVTPAPTESERVKTVYEPEIFEDGTVDIRPEVMHPRSMNCRQQFDQAFYCQSLGGKFNDIYRYGHFRSCSEQWSAFWLCMRNRTLDDDVKAAETTSYYADRDAKRRKQHGSSEDIWDVRTRSVKRAFWKDPDAPRNDTAIEE